jgi:hypothetical protein
MDEDLSKKTLAVPKSDISDKLIGAAKVVLNLAPIPWMGAALEILNMVLTPPVEKRRDKWAQNVSEVIQELYKRKALTVEDLRDNEEFISLLLQATNNWFKTHEEEKRRMLKNALLNSIESGFQYDIQKIFLNLIDELTVSHIQVLKTLDEHRLYLGTVKDVFGLHRILPQGDKYGTTKKRVFIPAINPIEITQLMYIVNDLKSKNLLYVSDGFKDNNNEVHEITLRAMEDGQSQGKPFLKVSDLGSHFLKYIEDEEVS